MGILYLIRHGQRFPLKNFPNFKSAFGDEPIEAGELTGAGKARMQQLGATFKDVTIVKTKFSGVRRCEESLTEFLRGAGCSVQSEEMGDKNFVSFDEFAASCDIATLKDAVSCSVRNRKALDELNEKYLPSIERGFLRDVAGGAFIDALAVLEDRGVQEMTADLKGLDLDFAVALTLALRSYFGEAIRKTILEAFENNDGHTVALVSDMHLLYVLQRVAPLLIHKRPPFGSVLKMTPLEEKVLLQYENQDVEIPWAEFRRRIELDIPISHF